MIFVLAAAGLAGIVLGLTARVPAVLASSLVLLAAVLAWSALSTGFDAGAFLRAVGLVVILQGGYGLGLCLRAAWSSAAARREAASAARRLDGRLP